MINVYRTSENNTIIKGKGRLAFILCAGTCDLSMIEIYEDGLVRLDGENDLISFDHLIERVKVGEVITHLPEGASGNVCVYRLCNMDAKNITTYIENDDFIKELEDIMCDLTGKESKKLKCVLAYKSFMLNPTEAGMDRLDAAYHEVAEHERNHLGDPYVINGNLKLILNKKVNRAEIIELFKFKNS